MKLCPALSIAAVAASLATAAVAEESALTDYQKVLNAVIAADGQVIFWQGDDLKLVTASIDDRYTPGSTDTIQIGFFGDSFDFVGTVLIDENQDGQVDFVAVGNEKRPHDESHQLAFDRAVELLAQNL